MGILIPMDTDMGNLRRKMKSKVDILTVMDMVKKMKQRKVPKNHLTLMATVTAPKSPQRNPLTVMAMDTEKTNQLRTLYKPNPPKICTSSIC